MSLPQPFHEDIVVHSTLAESKYTGIEAINAVANYWKHHEEWPRCSEQNGECLVSAWNRDNRRTVEIVTSLGMSPSLTGNMRTAASAPGALEPGKWVNVQLMLGEDLVTLLVDGKIVATNDSFTLNPEDFRATVC